MSISRRSLLATSVAVGALSWPGIARAQGVSGAGSTLVHPLLSRWSKAYQRAQTDAEYQPVAATVDYEPMGSQAGVMRLTEGGVDFAATEMPLGTEELKRYGFAQFPIAIGGIGIAVNVEGVASGRLRLTGELIADIFLGEIKTWSDARLKALNPDLALPDAPIAVLRRQDGSGTTYNFTNYLSGQSPAWKQKVGQGLTVAWPIGNGAKGNDGLAVAVRSTPNAIGYVDFAQARRAGLALAQLRNRAGQFVIPSVKAFSAAAETADWAGATDFNLLLNDAPGEAAYPIVATAFAVLPRQPSAGVRGTVAFLHWALERGSDTATELGYVPLPPSLVARVKDYWKGPLQLGALTLPPPSVAPRAFPWSSPAPK